MQVYNLVPVSTALLSQTRRSVLKSAVSGGPTVPYIETRAYAEHSTDEEMDKSLKKTVQQTVDQALVELEEAGNNGSIRAVTETVVTTTTMQSSGTVLQDVSNTAGPSHAPKAHSTPYREGVKTGALLDCSDSEAECSVLTRRPLYQTQQEEETQKEEEETDGGNTASPPAEMQAPAWMNLRFYELFLLVAVGLCLTALFWYTLQRY